MAPGQPRRPGRQRGARPAGTTPGARSGERLRTPLRNGRLSRARAARRAGPSTAGRGSRGWRGSPRAVDRGKHAHCPLHAGHSSTSTSNTRRISSTQERLTIALVATYDNECGAMTPWSYPISVDSSPLSNPGPAWSPLLSVMNGGVGAKLPRSRSTWRRSSALGDK